MKYLIKDTTLTDIADAIREKTGSSELISPIDMPTAIGSITVGGGGLTEWTIKNKSETGNYSHPTSYDNFNEYMDGKNFTINTDHLGYLFTSCVNTVDLSKVVINYSANNYDAVAMFNMNQNLEYLPTLNIPDTVRLGVYRFYDLFRKCQKLRSITDNFWIPFTKSINIISDYSFYIKALFQSCYSLREVPDMSIFKEIISNSTNQNYSLYNQLFYECYNLDTIEDLPVINFSNSITNNMFIHTFYSCYRLKDITFTTDNGTPIARTWSNQTIDLSRYVGYDVYGSAAILNYNSGITEDKQVIDNTTYQALKDDPDWFATNIAYSRYNHDSAVRTINSLPDCSSGTGNTIKFKGDSGSATDGGAINTLTEEEIAVAIAKGWTVSIS